MTLADLPPVDTTVPQGRPPVMGIGDTVIKAGRVNLESGVILAESENVAAVRWGSGTKTPTPHWKVDLVVIPS